MTKKKVAISFSHTDGVVVFVVDVDTEKPVESFSDGILFYQ